MAPGTSLSIPGKPYRYITEGLPFQFTFFVPQDMAGLIELLGGRDAVVHKLDELFAKGYYDHGNEPSHHIAYLYDFAGAPWKTQQRVHAVLEEQYTDKQAGLAGNDDCGQMSAWYAMSALGIYQVAPGIPVYELGTPAFDSAIVHTEGGHRFTLRASGASEGKLYIQSATLNGKPLHHPWITDQDIVSGGELVLKMGPAPNFAWGASPADAPPSMSSLLKSPKGDRK